MKILLVFNFVLCSLVMQGCAKDNKSEASKTAIAFWLTSPSTNVLFQLQKESLHFGNPVNQNITITVDTAKTFQTIDGFGNCLTGGSATLLHKMDTASRSAILKELFATDGNNIGISYLRISIGASDLDPMVFSYNDLPDGETDPELTKFTLNAERVDLIPVLKEILAINPAIKIMGSPWSASEPARAQVRWNRSAGGNGGYPRDWASARGSNRLSPHQTASYRAVLMEAAP